MIKIKKFVFNPFFENTFVVWDDETLLAAVIDPGCSNSKEENELKGFIKNQNLKIEYLLNTHCHIDHILGCNFILKEYSPVYYAPELDLPLLENAEYQASMFGLNIQPIKKPDNFLDEETKIKIGSYDIQVLFTPGHTPGEVCFYFPLSKICISGDVLFQGSIGRTDLMGGNLSALLNSIKSRLLSLPAETIIYPGHGPESTIEEEKKYNPFLREIV
ncbi:MAG: MBL fold metallo-hydrolase [Ignavibacteriales bacterium]|nr:MAG: MBL fold metallo-hydrolase [Ignavibacteriales bacterium]